MMHSRFVRQNRVGLVGAIALIALLGGFQARATANEGLTSSDLRISQASGATDGVLLLDDSGEAVTQLQTRLANLGFYNGPMTSYFGPLTEEAVIAFQQSRGLAADGVVGPSTWEALQQTGGSAGNDNLLQLGDAGTEVSTVQSRLSALGYYQGAVDGMFGSLTESAVMAFQQAQGLYPDGIVGPSTQQALTNGNVAARPPVGGAPAPTLPAQPAPVQPAPVEPAPIPPIAQLPPADMEGPYSVLDLQWKLRNHGFYYGPLDGVMGEEMQRAIAEAQAEYGLTYTDLEN